MKDEEMAEEHAEELEKKAIDVIRNQSHKLIDNFTQEDLENREISIFLAGYHEGFKAGRPQWHDLRKDPNDLPKLDKDFVVKVTIPVMTHPSYVFATYYFDNKKWFSFGEEIEVIAWCEIPTFDKE